MNAILEHIRGLIELAQVIWPSLLAAAALAIAGGVVGLFVVLRRESLVALSMPQIVTLGAAFGLRQGWPTLPPAIAAVLIALVMLAWSRRHDVDHLLLPALYVGGLCLSILLVANAGAELIEVQNLFTGIDVAVGEMQSIITASVLLVVATTCAVLWRRWLLLAQAPATAELAGLHPMRWNALFLSLLAIVLVLATNSSGAVMVVTMLFLPAATAMPWADRIPPALALSVASALMFLCVGFILSNEMNWPLSQSVGGAGVGMFLVSHLVARIVRG